MTAPISAFPHMPPAAPAPRPASPSAAVRFGDILDGLREARNGTDTATFDETGMFGRQTGAPSAAKQRPFTRQPAPSQGVDSVADALDGAAMRNAAHQTPNIVRLKGGEGAGRIVRPEQARTPVRAVTASANEAIFSSAASRRAMPRRDAPTNGASAPKFTFKSPGGASSVEVFLFAVEHGHRVLARAGALNAGERASLREAIDALLRQHGIMNARIEIMTPRGSEAETNHG